MTQTKRNVFEEWVERYQNNPVMFVDEVLGVTPDKWQIKFLMAIAKGNRRVSVRSGHGVGKSTASAWAMLWYFMTRSPVKVVVTAPTSSQLFDAMFAELKRWVLQMPQPLQDLVTVKQDRIVFNAAPDEMFISARTSRAEQPEALQGIHSDNVMLVADEASGVPEQVFEAAAGSMSGHNAVTLLLGNPTRSSGFFYDTHNRLSSEWVTFRVSCEDSPRVSTEYISEMASRYGEESNAYRIRVLGEFPRSDDDTIISMELIEAAKNRDVAPTQYAPMIWGLDVARFGSDSSSLTKRKGNTVTEASRVWRNLDLMQLTGAVVAEYEAQKQEDKPESIMVDSIGLGAGVVDRLKELGLPAVGINVSESPSFSPNQTYANLKAELWYKAKAWFEKRDCRIPDDSRLTAELATVRYTFSSTGKTRVESKEDIKKRGLKSPDCFVAGTMIKTPNGQRPIESLRSGDWVSTPLGARRVLKLWESETEELTTVKFSSGNQLTGKGAHKIFTWDMGWVRLDSLQLCNTIESATTIGRLKWLLVNLCSTRERSFGFKHQVDISSQGGNMSLSDFCTGGFGLNTTDPYRTEFRYTTRMATGATTMWPTWSLSIGQTMRHTTCLNDGAIQAMLPTCGKHLAEQLTQRVIGIQPQKDWSGTSKMEKQHGKNESQRTALAWFAAACSQVFSQRDPSSAQRNAPKPTTTASCEWLLSALSARLSSFATNIGVKNVALTTAPQSSKVSATKVYNLTLDFDNVYYANGILVANCADSLILTFAGDAATAIYGSGGGSKSWAKPLRRNVPRLA